jgi:hypothetical protein
MKPLILFILATLVCGSLSAQYVYTIKADSVKLTGASCDSTELILLNHTQAVPGFLYNTGNGRTVFQRGIIKINDTLYQIGADTLNLQAGGGGIPTLADIPSLIAYAGSARSVLVKDTARGGVFYYSPTAGLLDSGIVFPATGVGSGYWVRKWDGTNVQAAWFGVTGDSTQNSYFALQRLAGFVNYKGGALNIFFPPGNIFINEVIKSGSTATNIIYHNLTGVRFWGNETKISSFGAFDHGSGTWGDVVEPFTFNFCSQITMDGIELNGNLQNTISTGGAGLGSDNGLSFYSCTGVTLNNLYIHHWAAYGLLIGGLSNGTQVVSSRRFEVTNCRISHNAADNILVSQLYQGNFSNVHSYDAGLTDGSFPAIIGRGVECTPVYSSATSPAVDVQQGYLTFSNCIFQNNLDFQFLAYSPAAQSNVTVANCLIDKKNQLTQGGSIGVTCPGSLVMGNTIDGDFTNSGSTGVANNAGVIIRDNVINAFGSTRNGIDTYVNDNTFKFDIVNNTINYADTLFAGNFMSMHMSSGKFEGNTITIPTSAFTATSGPFTTIGNVPVIRNNRWVLNYVPGHPVSASNEMIIEYPSDSVVMGEQYNSPYIMPYTSIDSSIVPNGAFSGSRLNSGSGLTLGNPIIPGLGNSLYGSNNEATGWFPGSTSIYFRRGDVMMNNSPSVTGSNGGANFAWICYSAGTPGNMIPAGYIGEYNGWADPNGSVHALPGARYTGGNAGLYIKGNGPDSTNWIALGGLWNRPDGTNYLMPNNYSDSVCIGYVYPPQANLHVRGSVRFDIGSDGTGDIPVRNSAGNLAPLHAGAEGQTVAISSGVPTYVNPENVVTVTSSYAASVANTVIIANFSSGNIYLPAASGNQGRRVYVRTATGSQTATVIPSGGQIEQSLGTLGSSASVSGMPTTAWVSDGTNWMLAY